MTISDQHSWLFAAACVSRAYGDNGWTCRQLVSVCGSFVPLLHCHSTGLVCLVQCLKSVLICRINFGFDVLKICLDFFPLNILLCFCWLAKKNVCKYLFLFVLHWYIIHSELYTEMYTCMDTGCCYATISDVFFEALLFSFEYMNEVMCFSL